MSDPQCGSEFGAKKKEGKVLTNGNSASHPMAAVTVSEYFFGRVGGRRGGVEPTK